MSILDYLFGHKGKTDQEETATSLSEPTTTAAEAAMEPSIDLFVDNETPKQEQTIKRSESIITELLRRDWSRAGINDGYEYHSHEMLETAKKKIRAEFQLNIDHCIQEKFEYRLRLRNMVVDVRNISDDVRQKLENTIEEVNTSISILQVQKELSSDNEGWVMNAIHSYHQGFVKGLNDWLAGEQLLSSISNI